MNASSGPELDSGYAAFTAGNYGEARQCFEKALAIGHSQCAVNLGWLYERGLGGKKDLDQAVAMYRLAMPTQPALSNYYLGRTFKEMGNSENALPHLEAAAALGNPSAAYWAHAIYSDAGQTGEAQKFLLLAGELGHVYAQRDLARSSLSNASSIGAWMASLYKYFKVKATGVVLVLKNAEDPRVN